jgi:hypothetical protein
MDLVENRNIIQLNAAAVIQRRCLCYCVSTRTIPYLSITLA